MSVLIRPVSIMGPEVGAIHYLDALAQSALPDKRPTALEILLPASTTWLWPILRLRGCPLLSKAVASETDTASRSIWNDRSSDSSSLCLVVLRVIERQWAAAEVATRDDRSL